MLGLGRREIRGRHSSPCQPQFHLLQYVTPHPKSVLRYINSRDKQFIRSKLGSVLKGVMESPASSHPGHVEWLILVSTLQNSYSLSRHTSRVFPERFNYPAGGWNLPVDGVLN